MKELKPFPALKYKHYQEVKDLLLMYQDHTIGEAAKKLGIDPNNLRTLAFRVGVKFLRANRSGKTTVDQRAKKPHVTLAVEPWMLKRDRGEA